MKSSFLVICDTCNQVLYLSTEEGADLLPVPPEAKQTAKEHAASTGHTGFTFTTTYEVTEVFDAGEVHILSVEDNATGDEHAANDARTD